jgi:hypothetical protein
MYGSTISLFQRRVHETKVLQIIPTPPPTNEDSTTSEANPLHQIQVCTALDW